MTDFVTEHNIDGTWLINGQLNVCFLKLNPAPKEKLEANAPRPENVSILKSILVSKEGEGRSLLEEEVNNDPVFLLAPELVFGSNDFEEINSVVKSSSSDLILVAGFGFSDSMSLTAQTSLPEVEGVWDTPLVQDKKYNGAWVWVKTDTSIKCFVCLKNFFEQQAEVSIPNLALGRHILRLNLGDLVVFPLICAEMLSTQDNSPNSRIIASLKEASNGSSKTLITASLLNTKSHSGHWKAAVGDLLENLKDNKARVLLSNCINPQPLENEQEDKWRCLTGGFGHLADTSRPRLALPNLRYVSDTKFSGLVLRNPAVGVRRHIKRHRFRPGPRETLLTLLVDIRRRLCGIATVVVRLSFP